MVFLAPFLRANMRPGWNIFFARIEVSQLFFTQLMCYLKSSVNFYRYRLCICSYTFYVSASTVHSSETDQVRFFLSKSTFLVRDFMNLVFWIFCSLQLSRFWWWYILSRYHRSSFSTLCCVIIYISEVLFVILCYKCYIIALFLLWCRCIVSRAIYWARVRAISC